MILMDMQVGSTLEFDYVNRSGLVVRSQGIELVSGSFLQFYAPGWTKGYYSSNWNDQTITRRPDGSLLVTFKSGDGKAEGTQTYWPSPMGFRIDCNYLWRGDEPCLVESTIGLLKLRPFTKFSAGQKPQDFGPARKGDEVARRLAADPQRSFVFSGPSREVTVSSTLPFIAFDARGYEQEWARRQDLLWLGHPAIELKKGVPVSYSVTVEHPIRMAPMLRDKAISATFAPLKQAVKPWEPRGVRDMQLSGKPKLEWRGLHLFVGPQSEAVHAKLARDVLPKLKINKVLLQCEQSRWSSLKTDTLKNFTDLASLKRIFDTYRKNGIEPIPLIQSFGHMEWFFAGGQNRDLAFNPLVPYAIDPRKPEAVAAILKIWDEAIKVLKPKEIHFGLDEVDMRGAPDDPALTTELWRKMIPQLAAYADSKKLPWMLWGDQMLGPGQAPDAALGDSVAEAAKRREVVPKTATITDWHYLNNPNPAVYNNVALWKQWGFRQIGSVWNRPDNVYGYTHAIINHGERGMLQTTWAGYYLSERSMLDNWGQYASTVLLADYSFSGRKERPKDLPYKPETVLRDLWFGGERRTLAGSAVIWDTSAAPTDVPEGQIVLQKPLRFYDTYQGGEPFTSYTFDLPNEVSEIKIMLRARNPVVEGKSVLLATIGEEDESVHYGWDVRVKDDLRPLFRAQNGPDGTSVVTIRFETGSGPNLVLKQLDDEAALEIMAITLVPHGKSR
ncbi:MAG: hypothetical protein JNJ45_04530 [Chthonomonas sp.]|nr:hypothetical protein [Chthonomonas sp.]